MAKKIKYTLVFGMVALLLAMASVFLFTSSHEEVFPRVDDVNYYYGHYHEDIEEDWSEVKLDSSSNSFKMSYKLSRATRTPFVASYIVIDEKTKTLAEIKDHNTLRINLESKVGMRIPIMVTFDYMEGQVKENGKPFPMMTLKYQIEYTEAGNYDIAIDEMQIPDWWFRVHRLHRNEVDRSKITNVRGIIVGSCTILKEKNWDTIEVNKIEFYTDNSNLYRKVFGCVMGLTLLVLVLVLKKNIAWKQ